MNDCKHTVWSFNGHSFFFFLRYRYNSSKQYDKHCDNIPHKAAGRNQAAKPKMNRIISITLTATVDGNGLAIITVMLCNSWLNSELVRNPNKLKHWTKVFRTPNIAKIYTHTRIFRLNLCSFFPHPDSFTSSRNFSKSSIKDHNFDLHFFNGLKCKQAKPFKAHFMLKTITR